MMGIHIKGFNDDSWGMFEANQDQQFQGDPHIEDLPFDLERHPQGINHSPPVSKKCKLIGNAVVDEHKGEYAQAKYGTKKAGKGI